MTIALPPPVNRAAGATEGLSSEAAGRRFPYLPFVGILGFVPLPAMVPIALALITVTYVIAAEMTKSWFYRGATA